MLHVHVPSLATGRVLVEALSAHSTPAGRVAAPRDGQ
jgi:hypothetical protein